MEAAIQALLVVPAVPATPVARVVPAATALLEGQAAVPQAFGAGTPRSLDQGFPRVLSPLSSHLRLYFWPRL